MKRFATWLGLAAALALAVPVWAADGLLGKKGGSGGNSGGGSAGGGDRPRVEPPPRRQGGGDGGGGGNWGGFGGPSDPGWGVSQGASRESGLLGKRDGPSRSGEVGYGSVNNVPGARVGGSPIVIGEIPVFTASGEIRRGAGREDRVRVGGVPAGFDQWGWRRGYWHYDDRWVDDYFWYPHYRFYFSPGLCVPSPWYWYTNLPAFIVVTRVDLTSWGWSFGGGRPHSWRQPDRFDDDWRWGGDSRERELDFAVDDIFQAFRRGSVRPLSGLIPSDSRIGIELPNQIRYTIGGDDFYDLIRDLIQGTRTSGYEIVQVRRDGRRAIVVAAHTHQDAWGWPRRTYHTWGLEEGRRGYVIAYFRADNRRPLW